ncbi:hypothetical protein CY34DRAFT_19159 [Suillus luteus UH-Slu-Lm8-n1]|uniref:Uncharacterized protein n=1 Tax=Suillus luteus UH-Slu-Lm8-n1 TaxID=930992 RepID=A0A0D0ADG0_9AGAM|nr:hypothetical protein CY34DRAFT_19159 [Suillus luteus UH-Slu-Lm8-n1]
MKICNTHAAHSTGTCALSTGNKTANQAEPASVFATYWHKLSNADKEVYKRKATARLNSSSSAQGLPASSD